VLDAALLLDCACPSSLRIDKLKIHSSVSGSPPVFTGGRLLPCFSECRYRLLRRLRIVSAAPGIAAPISRASVPGSGTAVIEKLSK
jgi:hypothetical protein